LGWEIYQKDDEQTREKNGKYKKKESLAAPTSRDLS